MFATRLRCVSITPFASPVVPDEYGSTTTSSRSTGTCSASGAPATDGDRRVAVGLADDVHLADLRVGDRRRGRLEEHRDGHQPGRARVDELVVHLARRVRRVDRGEHATGQRDGVEHDAVVGAVRRHHRDDLALGEPALEPAARLAAHRLLELAVGHRPTGRAVDERRLAGQLAGALEDVRRQRPSRERRPAAGDW